MYAKVLGQIATLQTHLRSLPWAEVHVWPERVVLEDEADSAVGVVRRVALLQQPGPHLPRRRLLQGRHLR